MKVYFLETAYAYREWNDLFLELVFYLKETYDAKIIHQKGKDGLLHVEKFNFDLQDCQLLIHNEEKDKLWGITFEDNPLGFTDLFIKRNKRDDSLILSQFANRFPKDFDKSIFNFNLTSGTWYPSMSTTNFDFFYRQRLLNNQDLIDKMFYMGMDYRLDIPELRKQNFCNTDMGNLHQIDYLFEAIKYKLGLSIAGVGEICYRDFEYMAIGLPMIRIEYMTQLNPPLIPNYHYIALPRKDFPWDVNKDRNGGLVYVEAYKKRFLEVKDNSKFLNFIAKNAREYYYNYSHPVNRLKHITRILNL